tara:strand:- start:872 stop:1108 length:237 start_codon:yes stop_codon:yes gene_type:complete
MRNNYRLLRIELKGKKEDTTMYEEIKKELIRAKSQYYDWKVTQPEDGYTKDYIAGRLFGIQVTINTLQRLLEKSVQEE